MKFRKKPVVIEATLFTQDMFDTIVEYERNGRENLPFDIIVMLGGDGVGPPWLFIKTLEGNMRLRVGDWIIRGVKGEFYPVKPDIFAATYEPVEDA